MFQPLLLPVILSALLITGCANRHIAQNDSFDQSTLDTAAEFSGDSEKALQEAEIRYEAAIAADMNFYAPLHMAQANELLASARTAEIKGLQSDSIIASARVITLLTFAETNKKKVEVLLKPLLEQKKVLEQLNSPRILPDNFADGLEDIKDLITQIEEGKEDIAPSDIDTTLNNLIQLEVETLLETHWQPAQNTLEKAENEGADKNAPQSFLFAEELVEQAEEDIRAQFSDREFVATKGLAALRAAQHALYVARDAEQLLKLTQERAEQAVLKFESLLAQIGATLNAQDVRHMALQDQATALAQSAETQASRMIVPLQKRIMQLEKLLESKAAPLANTDEASNTPEEVETPDPSVDTDI